MEISIRWMLRARPMEKWKFPRVKVAAVIRPFEEIEVSMEEENVTVKDDENVGQLARYRASYGRRRELNFQVTNNSCHTKRAYLFVTMIEIDEIIKTIC